MPSFSSLSLHVETKTQSPVVGVGCLPLVLSCLSWASRRSARSSFRPSARLSVRLACLPHMPPLRFSSAHHLIRSPFPRRLASSSSAHRLAPCLVSPGSPPHSTSGTGRHERRAIIYWRADGGEHRTDGGVCLLTSDGDGLRAVIDGGWLRAAGVAVCLPLGDGRSGSIVPQSFLNRSSFPLIGSSNRLGPGSSHHLIISSTGDESSFPFRLTPSRLPFSVCLLWLVPPSPAGGCVGCGMACGGGRADCLLAFSSPVPLSRCRSFARCYMPCVARAARSFLGRRWAFYGLF